LIKEDILDRPVAGGDKAQVRLGSILLKKSFGGGGRNFLEPPMRLVRSDVRGHVASQTTELSKNQHLRDFWRRSIFDFFNSIGQRRKCRRFEIMSG
jgi:hypothetical protein